MKCVKGGREREAWLDRREQHLFGAVRWYGIYGVDARSARHTWAGARLLSIDPGDTRREPAPAAIEGADVAPLVPDRAATGRMVGTVVLLAASFLALDPIGYRLTALVFLVLVLLVLGVRNIVAIAAVALVGSFGVFHSFYYWLKVPLPIGMFGI
jgi:hypothetical protein